MNITAFRPWTNPLKIEGLRLVPFKGVQGELCSRRTRGGKVSIDVLLAGGLSLKRLALRLVLEKGSEFTVVGEAIDVAEALAMCLLDVNSKGMGGSYLGDGKICVVILKTWC